MRALRPRGTRGDPGLTRFGAPGGCRSESGCSRWPFQFTDQYRPPTTFAARAARRDRPGVLQSLGNRWGLGAAPRLNARVGAVSVARSLSTCNSCVPKSTRNLVNACASSGCVPVGVGDDTRVFALKLAALVLVGDRALLRGAGGQRDGLPRSALLDEVLITDVEHEDRDVAVVDHDDTLHQREHDLLQLQTPRCRTLITESLRVMQPIATDRGAPTPHRSSRADLVTANRVAETQNRPRLGRFSYLVGKRR